MPPKVEQEDERPAGKGSGVCFYCQQSIGSRHDASCVVWKRKVVVRMTVEYEVEVPYSWDKHNIEFHRNESSWCAGNALEELQSLDGESECLCPYTKFEYVRDVS